MFNKVYIEITNICNLKCRFCPVDNRKKEFVSVENFEEIIKKIYKYTKLVSLHVKGEPLMHPELQRILEILVKYDLKANITTNGILLKEKLEVLKNSKSVRQINISIHSMKENNTTNTNYLEDIFNSVEQLKNIIISYRLWNLSDIANNIKNKDIINKLEDYYKIYDLEEVLKKKDYFKIKDNLYINQDIEFIWPNINNPHINEKGRCLALKEQIAILVDGTVVPCCLDNNGDIKLGNIYEESLEDILNKPISKKIKKNFENSIITCDLCKTCGFLKRLENKRTKQ